MSIQKQVKLPGGYTSSPDTVIKITGFSYRANDKDQLYVQYGTFANLQESKDMNSYLPSSETSVEFDVTDILAECYKKLKKARIDCQGGVDV